MPRRKPATSRIFYIRRTSTAPLLECFCYHFADHRRRYLLLEAGTDSLMGWTVPNCLAWIAQCPREVDQASGPFETSTKMVDPQKIELKISERVTELGSPMSSGDSRQFEEAWEARSGNNQAEKGPDAVQVDSYLQSPGLLAECLGEIKITLKSTRFQRSQWRRENTFELRMSARPSTPPRKFYTDSHRLSRKLF